jgi:NosR/NirI family nitrous oxide reductase transcriptional regulator
MNKRAVYRRRGGLPLSALLALLITLLQWAQPAGAGHAAYEAPLPAQISTDPDLCAYLPCKDVLPGAESFSVRKGRPSYVEAYGRAKDRDEEHYDEQDVGEARNGDRDAASDRKDAEHEDEPSDHALIGYVFLSTDIVDIPAYSGKPVVTLIGMDTRGIITGIKILKHSEPILLVGIPEEELTKFTKQYVGKFVGSKIEIGSASGEEGTIGVDAISGATVTVIAENQVILRSGYEIAKQVGILQAKVRPQPVFAEREPATSWSAMVDEGSVQRLTVQATELGLEKSDQPYIDMYFGYLNAPAVGRAILGDDNYRRLMAELKPNEHAIFIVANGTGSFKGSGFVRGGIFDRIQVAQEIDTFTFRDLDYHNLYSIRVPGAPAFTESGIFIIRREGFSAAYPWSLVFLANRVDRETGERSFANFSAEYWLPDSYMEGGRPEYERPEPPWMKVWKTRAWELGGFALILLLTALMFANRDKLVRASRRRDKTPLEGPKYLIWTVSVLLVGVYAMAQPSITQVMTWFHSIVYEWKWELFLSDPFIFIFWWFIIITVFFWGRGLFCGWLCPYGAGSEILHKIAGHAGLKRYQFSLPKRWHDRLKWTKYFIFAGLLGLSFYSMPLAERYAEVEPFKTTFLVGVWNRSWPFVTYWAVLAVLSLFIERPFCKYLCPLGAALAVPSTFRFFGLKRKAECTACAACAKGCSQLAIDRQGRIDQRECLLCLDCMVLYYDAHTCPPLVKERKAREKLAMPLTRINPRGYFEPLPSGARAAPATVAEPAAHPGAPSGRLAEELWFHLLPWRRDFGREIFFIRAIAALLAVSVTTAWILSATQQIGPAVMLAWWMGWSVYEVMTRMHYKPLVKDGPWWGRSYRTGSWMDVTFYVATKNLLIAAALFLLLQATGALDILSRLPWLR